MRRKRKEILYERKEKRSALTKKRDYQAFIYLAPWLIGLIVLQMYHF